MRNGQVKSSECELSVHFVLFVQFKKKVKIWCVVTHLIMQQKTACYVLNLQLQSVFCFFLQQIKACNKHSARLLHAYLCSTVALEWRPTRTPGSCAYIPWWFVCLLHQSKSMFSFWTLHLNINSIAVTREADCRYKTGGFGQGLNYRWTDICFPTHDHYWL